MPPFFIPARSSRHRRACFALYRALRRQAARVPLPDDVGAAAAKTLSEPPIGIAIRNAFHMNREDTSPRLVVGALENGYKFLDVLAKAQTPDSQENASIVSFLRQRLRNGLVTVINPKTKHKKKPPPQNKTPLFTRRYLPALPGTAPGQLPEHQLYEYVPTVRPLPLSALRSTTDGRRRVPRLVTEASGIPFLRLQRPQSPILSNILRKKGLKRRNRMKLFSELQRDGRDFAAEEDLWETTVLQLLRDEGRTEWLEPMRMVATPTGEQERPAATYVQSVDMAINYINAKLHVETADMLARSRAMLQLVDDEAALAVKEEAERRQALSASQTEQAPQADGVNQAGTHI